MLIYEGGRKIMDLKLNKKYFEKIDHDLKLIPITYDFAFKKLFRGNLDILKNFFKRSNWFRYT